MKTALITVKTEPRIKKEAQKIAANLGLSLSAIINAHLHQFVKTKTFCVGDTKNEEPSDYLINALKQSEIERKKGDYYSFENTKDAIDFLDNIDNEN